MVHKNSYYIVNRKYTYNMYNVNIITVCNSLLEG